MTKTPFPIRLFKPDDLAEVKELIHRTLDADTTSGYPPVGVAYHKQLHTPQRILRDVVNGHTVVMVDHKKIIATGTLVGSLIKRVFIDPAYQRQGLGQQVMAYLEKHALKNGKNSVCLDASKGAKAFYLRLGYHIDHETFIPLDHEVRLVYFKMSKSLLAPDQRFISYHKKMFRPLSHQGLGLAEDAILYHFQQTGNRVWVSFKGGLIAYGQMLGLAARDGSIQGHYQYLTRREHLIAGSCLLKPTRQEGRALTLGLSWSHRSPVKEEGIMVLKEMDLNGSAAAMDPGEALEPPQD